MGDDIVDLSTKNDAFKSKIGFYYEKWLQESKNKMLEQIDDEKRANIIVLRMKKTDGKTLNIRHILVIINYGNQNSMVSFSIQINYKI